MNYREIWTDADFVDMGWHDALIYSMSFPQANYAIRFDIDYIFKWHWEREAVRGWDVAPCTLEFNNVSDLSVSLSWPTQGDTSIHHITRKNSRLSPNGKIMLWDYQIELDVGDLSFTATGFTQTVRKPPIFSTSQALGERGEAS
ncbi:hypothetical protein [Rhizobium indigoferae]|uniref:Uncharacterized protein n=1 Tax=Rhizobium indigoferae TaxID=158891 RepID=A0ABZ0ZB91_9HYPH|nr:hypothetical protein [Rhizobium indigoferae]NNU58491.1 hypothetical protein [Rhizobium indigoferae]WQN36659.1 hypothetical protein U5G49_001752 [Rhizobium indigoferae]GLR61138.1 hypothetical protein GCM10007919_58670 [Rhizobium indigoferae]